MPTRSPSASRRGGSATRRIWRDWRFSWPRAPATTWSATRSQSTAAWCMRARGWRSRGEQASLRGALATKQSRLCLLPLDCFAASDARSRDRLARNDGETLIRLDVIPPVFAHRGLQRRPVERCAAADVCKSFVDAAFHALEAADIDMGMRILEQPRDNRCFGADAVLHIDPRLPRHPRIAEMLCQQFLRHF